MLDSILGWGTWKKEIKMFKNILMAAAFSVTATPALAQEQASTTSAHYSYTTPLAPGVRCQTSDAIVRIEMAAEYAREDNPDADAATLERLTGEAVEEKVAQLSDGTITFPDGTVTPLDVCMRTNHSG
ncbi:MAG: hypothetical protein WBK28_02810 [Minisyncoccia bacterium]